MRGPANRSRHAHLSLPLRGPLPLPPEGWRGVVQTERQEASDWEEERLQSRSFPGQPCAKAGTRGCKGPSGKGADAQIEAFEDTWHWGGQSERAFTEVLASPYTQAAELLRAMRSFLGKNDLMAYLAMMAARLIELHRVLKTDRFAPSALRPYG